MFVRCDNTSFGNVADGLIFFLEKMLVLHATFRRQALSNFQYE